MTAGPLAPFACPSCHSPLEVTDHNGATCAGLGGHRFPLKDGAPFFLGPAPEGELALSELMGACGVWRDSQPRAWARERERVWRAVVRQAQDTAPPPGVFADVGSGDAGLAALAARAKYQAVAIDAALAPAGPYLRASASMAALPFADGTLTVAAYCAALHYASDVNAVLREARRALREDGALLLALTPLHESEEAAASAAETTKAELREVAGGGLLADSYHHLIEGDLRASLEAAGFALEMHPSGLGLAFRAARALKERLSGEAFARFPLIVARPRA